MPGGTHHLELGEGWLLWRYAALRGAGMPLDWLEPFAVPPAADGGAPDDATSMAVSAEAVRQVLRQEDFVAALAWQNPTMVENWLGGYVTALAAQDAPALRRRSQREAKIAKYAQRYCAKNDTIGFFGPVGWATLDETVPHTTISGTGELSGQSVYLEVWMVDQLAAHWSADARLLPHLPVRLRPGVSVRGKWLRRPRREPEQLTAVEAALLGAVGNGRRFADVVAHAAGGEPDDGSLSRELLRLRQAGLVRIGFAVPIDEHPELSLAAQVAAVPDAALRRELSAQLDRLEAARAEIAGLARSGIGLAGAMGRLDGTVRSLTGARRVDPADRVDPAHPADRVDPGDRVGRYGRGVAYVDCRRDLDAVIGADALDRLRGPLCLLLDSARWFADEVAGELLAELVAVAGRLAQRRTGSPVTLADLQLAAGDLLSGAPGTVVDRVVKDFRLRWREILPGPSGDAPDEVRLSTVDIVALAGALFPPPAAGRPVWASARYHSPDLMLGYLDGRAAAPVWVLGELHLALNTLENRVFHTQAADRDALLGAAAWDMRGGRVLPLYANDSPDATPRTYPPSAVHLPESFVYWSHADDSGHPSGAPALPSAGLVVTPDSEGGLTVTDPVSGLAAGILEFFGEFITAVVVNHFQLREPERYGPRVRVDDLVVCRRAWRLGAAELVAAAEGGGHALHPLRHHLERLGVPRYAFYKTPAEPKPSYVDLHAPLHLYNLDAAARRVLRESPADAHVDVVEMLPAPEHLWLTDPAGRRFTSELRVVAVDARPAGSIFTGTR